MTTERLAKKTAEDVRRMSLDEKFRVRSALDKAFPPKRWLN